MHFRIIRRGRLEGAANRKTIGVNFPGGAGDRLGGGLSMRENGEEFVVAAADWRQIETERVDYFTLRIVSRTAVSARVVFRDHESEPDEARNRATNGAFIKACFGDEIGVGRPDKGTSRCGAAVAACELLQDYSLGAAKAKRTGCCSGGCGKSVARIGKPAVV